MKTMTLLLAGSLGSLALLAGFGAAELPCLPSDSPYIACPAWTATHDAIGWDVAFAPDSTTVYVGRWGFSAEAYDVGTGAQRWASQLPDSYWIHGAALSPDGARFHLAGSVPNGAPGERSDLGVATFDTATGALLWSRAVSWNPVDYPEDIAVNPLTGAVYVAGGTYGTPFVVALDGPTGATLWEHLWSHPRATEGSFISLSLPADGARVFAGGYARIVGHGMDALTVALDAATGAEQWEALHDDETHDNNYIVDVRAAPAGAEVFALGSRYGAAAPGDGIAPLLAYDAATGAEFPSLPELRYGHQGGLAVSPDGAWVAQGGMGCILPYETMCDYAVAMHDASTGELAWWALRDARPFSGDIVEELLFTPDGSALLVGGTNLIGGSPLAHVAQAQDLQALDPATGLPLWTGTLGDRLLGLAVSPDGTKVAATGWLDPTGEGEFRGTALYELRPLQAPGVGLP